MGIPTKVTSFRLRDGSLREIGELQDVFAPAFKTRTSMVEWLIALGHTIFVRHQGEEILRQAQRLLCITDSAVSPSEGNAGLVQRPSDNGHRPRVLELKSSATRRGYFHCPEELGLGMAWGTSFHANSGRIFAGAQS